MPKRKPSRTVKSAAQEIASPAKSAPPAIGAEDLFQWNKSGFDSAVKLSNAILEGFEHIRAMQMQAAHEAHEKNDKAKRDLSQVRSPTDLAQLEMELLRTSMERATNYWQQLFAIGNDMNAKLVEEVKSEFLAANEKMNRTLGRTSKAAEKPAAIASPDSMKMAMDMTNLTLTSFNKAASQWMDTAKQNLANLSAQRH